MKKIGVAFCLLIAVGFLCLGFYSYPKTKVSSSPRTYDYTKFQHNSIVKGKKVYPKVHTAKGLSTNLYLPDNPTPAVIKINEAKQASFEGRPKEACDLWREALNLNPYHPEGIWHDIGLCSEELRAWDDAIEAYTKAIELSKQKFHKTDADLYDWYYPRAYVYLTKNDLKNAEKDFLTLVSIRKNDTSSYYQLAAIQ